MSWRKSLNRSNIVSSVDYQLRREFKIFSHVDAVELLEGKIQRGKGTIYI